MPFSKRLTISCVSSLKPPVLVAGSLCTRKPSITSSMSYDSSLTSLAQRLTRSSRFSRCTCDTLRRATCISISSLDEDLMSFLTFIFRLNSSLRSSPSLWRRLPMAPDVTSMARSLAFSR
uniref:Uncharacterized protein n=1 Tax=Arundo donax TaxID=35708 RepID=A0A0A9A718_ARUDO